MQFTANRKVVIAALGHVAAFEKGETKALPEALHQQAINQGLEPVDGEVTMPEKTDDGARTESIKEAMRVIAARNDSADFDAGGVPKEAAITAAGGGKCVDKRERVALWGEVSTTLNG